MNNENVSVKAVGLLLLTLVLGCIVFNVVTFCVNKYKYESKIDELQTRITAIQEQVSLSNKYVMTRLFKDESK